MLDVAHWCLQHPLMLALAVYGAYQLGKDIYRALRKQVKHTVLDGPETAVGFKIGDDVTWSSQAHGGWKTKIGKVVAVIPSYTRVGDVLNAVDAMAQFGMLSRKPLGFGGPRVHESYLVRVDRPGRKPLFHWPRVSALRRAIIDD